ncbi:trichohyalin-like [Macrobrachium rosenbergii]|uniref:trichohyalin-like n=1 Tax=Macrobrachium rosenbergii TaxID=79674 RepID=UPI0034D6B985
MVWPWGTKKLVRESNRSGNIMTETCRKAQDIMENEKDEDLGLVGVHTEEAQDRVLPDNRIAPAPNSVGQYSRTGYGRVFARRAVPGSVDRALVSQLPALPVTRNTRLQDLNPTVHDTQRRNINNIRFQEDKFGRLRRKLAQEEHRLPEETKQSNSGTTRRSRKRDDHHKDERVIILETELLALYEYHEEMKREMADQICHLEEERDSLRRENAAKDQKINRLESKLREQDYTRPKPPSTDQEGLTSLIAEIFHDEIVKALEEEMAEIADEEIEDRIQEELDEILQERQAERRAKREWDRRAFRAILLERKIRRAQRKAEKELKRQRLQSRERQEKEVKEARKAAGEWISSAVRHIRQQDKARRAHRKAEQQRRKEEVKSHIRREYKEMKAQKKAEKEWRERELLPIQLLEEALRNDHREWKKKAKREMKQEERERKAQRKAEGARRRKELLSRIMREDLERKAQRKEERERRKQALKDIRERKKDLGRQTKDVRESISSQKGPDMAKKEGSVMWNYAWLLLRTAYPYGI